MIFIDKESREPYYMQIYQHIKKEITSGAIPANSILTGSRILAKEIGVGRNTVDNAYAQLKAEGYIESVHGSGFQVLEIPELKLVRKQKQAALKQRRKEENPIKYDLSFREFSDKYFPFSQWRKYTAEALADWEMHKFNYYHQGNQGDAYLREQLAQFLHRSRGVNCHPEQIVVTCGMQTSIEILCKFLLEQHDGFGMEEPGYERVPAVLKSRGVTMYPLELDEQGVSISAIEKSPVKAVYVTPSHQSPTGIIMPIRRRYELLALARKNDFYILEDDYDGEFCYYNNPIPSLQSIDDDERVIYLGTFSKSLSPSLRMAFIVLPEHLLPVYQNKMNRSTTTVSFIDQLVVGKMIENGNYERRIRKLRTEFSKKHNLIIKEIQNMGMDIKIQFHSHGAGLNALLEFPEKYCSKDLIEAARQNGVQVYSAETFFMNPQKCPTNLLFIGYSSIDIQSIPDCIQRLHKAWSSL